MSLTFTISPIFVPTSIHPWPTWQRNSQVLNPQPLSLISKSYTKWRQCVHKCWKVNVNYKNNKLSISLCRNNYEIKAHGITLSLFRLNRRLVRSHRPLHTMSRSAGSLIQMLSRATRYRKSRSFSFFSFSTMPTCDSLFAMAGFIISLSRANHTDPGLRSAPAVALGGNSVKTSFLADSRRTELQNSYFSVPIH